MQEQKTALLQEAIRKVKALRHLTGNNSEIATVQQALKALKAII